MAKKERIKHSADKLRAASDHLAYEFWMMETTAGILEHQGPGNGPISNALLESFAMHVRVLLTFLYPSERLLDDDVIASDYFDSATAWTFRRPELSVSLAATYDRVNKEVAHLTYHRQTLSDDARLWHFTDIQHEVREIISFFFVIVPRELLGPAWADAGLEAKPKAPVGDARPVAYTHSMGPSFFSPAR